MSECCFWGLLIPEVLLELCLPGGSELFISSQGLALNWGQRAGKSLDFIFCVICYFCANTLLWGQVGFPFGVTGVIGDHGWVVGFVEKKMCVLSTSKERA